MDDTIKKILLINLQGIGDVVMTTPFIRQLKKHYKNAEVDYCCYKNNCVLLEDNENINNIIKRTKDDLCSTDFITTLQQIKNNKYDMIINLYHAQHSALLTILSNAQYKMGNLYNTACTTNNLAVENSSKTWDVRKNAKHVADQLGIVDYDETELEITLQKKEKKEVEELFKNIGIKKQVIGINPTAIWKAKTWPKEHWITLISNIVTKYKKYQIVLLGGPDNKDVAEQIVQRLNNNKNLINLAGELSLKQSATVLEKMKLFITGDTGLTHIAIAINIRTIALFGVTNPDILVRGAKNVIVLSTYASCPKKWRYNHNNEPPKEAQQQIAQIMPVIVMKEVEKILQ